MYLVNYYGYWWIYWVCAGRCSFLVLSLYLADLNLLIISCLFSWFANNVVFSLLSSGVLWCCLPVNARLGTAGIWVRTYIFVVEAVSILDWGYSCPVLWFLVSHFWLWCLLIPFSVSRQLRIWKSNHKIVWKSLFSHPRAMLGCNWYLVCGFLCQRDDLLIWTHLVTGLWSSKQKSLRRRL